MTLITCICLSVIYNMCMYVYMHECMCVDGDLFGCGVEAEGDSMCGSDARITVST